MSNPQILKHGVSPLAHYLHMKELRATIPATLIDGVWFRTLPNGSVMLEEDFRSIYPIPESPYGARCNPDGTKILKL